MTARIIDASARIVVDAQPGAFGSVDDVLRKMDANGVQSAVIAPHPAYETPHGVASSAAQNDGIRKILERWPDRFPAGLGSVEPRHGRPAHAEARRAIGELGLKGFSFDNDIAGLPIDSPSVMALLDCVADSPNLVMEFMTGTYSVLRSMFRLAAVANRFPQMQFVALNAFNDITHEAGSKDLADRCPNVWFDLGRSKSQLFTVERAVEALTVEKLLFGSVLPDAECILSLRMVQIAGIPEEQRALILAGNASRLFKLEETN